MAGGARCIQLRNSGTQQDSQIKDRSKSDLWNLRVNGLWKGPSREQRGRRNAVGGRVVKNFALRLKNALGAVNSLLFCSCSIGWQVGACGGGRQRQNYLTSSNSRPHVSKPSHNKGGLVQNSNIGCKREKTHFKLHIWVGTWWLDGVCSW